MNPCSTTFCHKVHGQWEHFLSTDNYDIPDMRPEILASWQRCRQMGVDPYNYGVHHHLQGGRLVQALKRRERLITIAHPFMANLYTIVKGTGFVVVLANEAGHIIELFGDKGVNEIPMTRNFFIGASWREEDAGTNAIGTALEIRAPIQVSSAEHFCRKHHCLTCSAAPIFDPENNLIGILDISGSYEDAHSHTLGMVVAAAKAIIAQLRIKQQNYQLAMANKKLIRFFNMVSDGVLIVDQTDTVIELNPAAERMLGYHREQICGQRLQTLICSDNPIPGKRVWEQPNSEIELVLETKSGPCPCLASAEPIIDEQETVTGGFLSLRPIKAVQNLVNRYSGYFAKLQFSDIIGESQGLQDAIRLAKLSALNASNVLLQGESGTGKEIFAQAIHNQSNRRTAPFIPLNCGAVPRELIGSELFGYEDGAFTGAKRGGKPGKFELADGGTLFLDEIGDMPLEQQAVLLRVIQEKRLTRIGGTKMIPVDVRLICATHKNLLKEVEKGTFRHDLFYRLNVMSITIPPLRDRIEDISLLFKHFMDQLGRDRGRKLIIDMDLMRFLNAYQWPGNVRELQNVAERAANLAVNDIISVDQLPVEIIQRRSATKVYAAAPAKQPANRAQRQKQRQERERHQLLTLLNLFEGNVTKVAKELGVCRKTVYNRMRNYAIEN